MDCCNDNQNKKLATDNFKILLLGNPNVGKSVFFSKLTGMDVLSANYTGTTVSFTKGSVSYKGNEGTLIDAPGTYALEATSPAEEVAVKLLEESDAVICVLDATNLERNLNLALQLKQHNIPAVFAINLIDVAERQGIYVDVKALEKELDAPVVPTVAIRNVGIKEVLEKALLLTNTDNESQLPIMTQEERWQEVGRIAEKVQRVEHRHPSFLEKLGDMTLKPFPGLPIAFFVLTLAMALVIGGGRAIRAVALLPLVNEVYAPFITGIVDNFIAEGTMRNVLVGEYGVLIKGIEWPFALILPYVFLFYIALSIMEDSGYMPRLGVLLDGSLRRIGIQGGTIVPFMMGYGCAVPAILGARAVTTKKERLMIAGLVPFAVPCIAQTGAFIVLLGDQSILLLITVYLISFAALILGGVVLDKIIPGKIDPMLLEIPNLLKPSRDALLKKIWMRTKSYVAGAGVPMLIAIGFAALVAEAGVLNYLSKFLDPLMEGWLGLPKEASMALILGIVRRELAVLPLLDLDLTTFQLLVGSLVALFYIPCLSVFGVLIKEYSLKVAGIILIGTISIAIFIAGVINQLGRLIGL